MPDARTERTRTETLRLARPEAMVEARPARPGVSPSASGDEMFLSPRVIDAGAFTRYAEALRALIAEARQGARDLQDFGADADEMTARCEKTAETVRARLEAGARMVKLIDERADRAERLVETARTGLPDEAAVRARIEPAVRAALDAAQARAAEITLDAERRARATATEIEQKLSTMAARAAEHAARLERAGEAIDRRLTELEARLDAISASAEATATSFESRVRAAIDAASTDLEPTLRRAAEAASSMDDALARAWRHADDRAGQLTERLAPLQTAADTVVRKLGLDPRDGDPAGSLLTRLESLVARSEASLGSADRVIGQVDSLRDQAEGVRRDFAGWLLETAEKMDALEARREQLTGPLSEAADKVARISPHLADELEMASTQLSHLQTEQAILREAVSASAVLASQATNRLNNHSGQLQALIDGSVRTLTQRVEEAGVWLGELIARAESAGRTLAPLAPAAPPTAAPASWPTIPATPAREPAAVEPKHPQPANSYGLPMPLPIDTVRFDGADVVFGRPDGAD